LIFKTPVFRVATVADIPQIQLVRNSVKENVLSNPSVVSNADCQEYLTRRGMGWVCEVDKKIVGFSIADLKDDNVWALFIDPDYEGKGIGKQLHELMLAWYFQQNKNSLWLSTAPNTRAERFYRKAGWKEKQKLPNGEIKFELTVDDWRMLNGQLPLQEL